MQETVLLFRPATGPVQAGSQLIASIASEAGPGSCWVRCRRASRGMNYRRRYNLVAECSAASAAKSHNPDGLAGEGGRSALAEQRLHVLKNTSQTPISNAIARAVLIASSTRTLGPGSACRDSVGVSTIRPCSDFGMYHPAYIENKRARRDWFLRWHVWRQRMHGW
jgi:hypothetical protein